MCVTANFNDQHYNSIFYNEYMRWNKTGFHDPAHCPKYNLNISNQKSEPVTVGADATVKVWILCHGYMKTNARYMYVYTVASAPAVTCASFTWIYSLFLRQCIGHGIQ